MRGTHAASDHYLVLGTFKITLTAFKEACDRPHHKFNTQRFKIRETFVTFGIVLQNRFNALQDLVEEKTMEERWKLVTAAWKDTCTEVLGTRDNRLKGWISSDTWHAISKRK